MAIRKFSSASISSGVRVSEFWNQTSFAGITVDFLVVGGGASGTGTNAGGGAGGVRSSVTATGGGGTLETALTLKTGTTYTITVGAGGAAGGNIGVASNSFEGLKHQEPSN